MSDIAIKIENVGKMYRLGEVGTGTISHDLNRWLARIRGKEDPFAKIGEVNDRTSKGKGDYVWAVKDINFEVKQGEVLGIIGRNGAGKSTLLKLLSKVTQPTEGQIKINGRIASLLEVGTGFHPEMTGRENIFLNGAIMGMTKAEIKRKFDEIVEFAGVERYVDTPVKRYSSGMYVRLAFAVAAHLEPEILIVDEVLAVGDAEFQKKCLGKMKDVSVNEGRTVLFVSHNMAAVKQLCTAGVVLRNGGLAYTGSALDAVAYYQNSHDTNSFFEHTGAIEDAPGNQFIRILKFHVKPVNGELLSLSSGVAFELEFYNHKENIALDATFELRNADEVVVFHDGKIITKTQTSQRGIYVVQGQIAPHILNAGVYSFSMIFGEDTRIALFMIQNFVQFEIMNEAINGVSKSLPGVIRTDIDFKTSFKTLQAANATHG